MSFGNRNNCAKPFALWWEEKQQGARGTGSNQYQQVASLINDATSLADYGLYREKVSKWRKCSRSAVR